MSEYLKIIDLDGNISPLRLNIAQRKLHKTIFELQRNQGLPIKVIICKARREGVSTYAEGLFFQEINHRPNVNATVVSADLDSTNKLFNIIKFFQEHLPDGIKKDTIASNRKEIAYSSPHYSKFMAQTAGKDILGRGGQTHYFHGSELGYWNNAKEQLGGALQEVPDKESMIILESTAFGSSGAFYEMFWQSVEDWKQTRNPKNFIPVFLPWFIFPDYQSAIPEGVNFVVGKAHAENYPSEWLEIEDELTKKYNLCPEQLFWRRWMIKNKCQGDLTLFDTEYPFCSRVAFSSSGRNVFVPSILDKMESQTTPGRTVVLEGGREGVRIVEVQQTKNCWRIWKMPQPDHDYTIGADLMEGEQADKDDARSEYDRHAASVFDRNTGEFVALYWGQGAQREVGEQILSAGYFYNEAWIAPELPTGLVVLDILKEDGYGRIYSRQKGDEQLVEVDGISLGWKTTIITRPRSIQDFLSAVQHEEIKIYSKLLISEMRTFVYNREGVPKHAQGKHDDALFSALIALQIHLRLPLNPAPYEYSTTHPGRDIKIHKSLAIIDAVDTWEAGNSDNDDPFEEYTD